jgi:hypothetical protein
MQAQDAGMCKWAVGVRSGLGASLADVAGALDRGEIVRTHVMRPTWHLVAAENIRWMLRLSAERIKAAARSRDRALEITEGLYSRTNGLIEAMLAGGKSLTRTEIASELGRAGVEADTSRMNHFMLRAETEGIVCSGVEKGGKPTYALLEERVAPSADLHREEALARLAGMYFRSHSPASLSDFAWWAGLTITEARRAAGFIEDRLVADRFGDKTLLVDSSCREASDDGKAILLPAFDEYIISYKNRSFVLDPLHYNLAFSAQGVFFPLILHHGAVIGRWARKVSKRGIEAEPAYFANGRVIDSELFGAAAQRYRLFCSK